MSCASGHVRPVHFNRGKHGHVWVCIACAKQLKGPSLPDDERMALIEFTKLITNENPQGNNTVKTEKESTMKLEVAMLVGAETKQFLMDLTKIVERMEKASASTTTTVRVGDVSKTVTKKAAAIEEEEDEIEAAVEAEEDEDFAPKKSKGKKAAAAAFDDDEPVEEPEATEEEEEDFTTPAPKKAAAKAKKLTIDDANDACKARAARTGGKEGRAEVLALLKKNFKTQSVTDVKPEDYEKLVKIMKA